MRIPKRTLALAVAGTLLAACSHKDKDAPLAFVPADTPYVVANLKVLDQDTRQAMLAQASAQLPGEVTQLRAMADQIQAKDPDSARLLRALAKELDVKDAQTFAHNIGLDLEGHSAIYGLGMAPVARFELTDPKAFDAFVGRLETAYGKPFQTARIGQQGYRRQVSAESGTQVILATVGRQAVAALLPADASEAMLRQALGLDRPSKNLQDDGRLADLAKAHDYAKWMVGDIDLTRLLPLAFNGKDPFVGALYKARARLESAKTGEPVANQLEIPPSCQTDAARIASRVPEISFGYTQLDAGHQDMRMDIALADDIANAFSGLQIGLPGLGAGKATSPLEFFIGLPVAQLRGFWTAQADAVAAKPFSCPALVDLNATFAKLGPAMQKAAIPPFGDFLGVGVALDDFTAGLGRAMPKVSGRLVLGTTNPAGLLAMGQMMTPALAQLKLAPDAKPAALPAQLSGMFGGPAWLAMGTNSLGLGIGPGEDAKLAETLKAPVGAAGRMWRMHMAGSMYLKWIDLMQQKADALTAATAALGKEDTSAAESPADKAAAAARTKAQFEAMRAQAARIDTIDAEAHVEQHGMVITSRATLK